MNHIVAWSLLHFNKAIRFENKNNSKQINLFAHAPASSSMNNTWRQLYKSVRYSINRGVVVCSEENKLKSSKTTKSRLKRMQQGVHSVAISTNVFWNIVSNADAWIKGYICIYNNGGIVVKTNDRIIVSAVKDMKTMAAPFGWSSF